MPHVAAGILLALAAGGRPWAPGSRPSIRLVATSLGTTGDIIIPGVDHDSLELLKEAKNRKRVFFALVVKGGTTEKLMAAKSKISPTEITAAKKEVGGSAAIEGHCQGEHGDLVFEMVKESAPQITSLTTKILKEAGL
jgi:hypothetical protein